MIGQFFMSGTKKMVKEMDRKYYKALIYCLLIPVMALVINGFLVEKSFGAERFSYRERQSLVQLFENSEFETTAIRKIFFDKRLKKMPVIVNRNVNNKEIKRNYDDFLSSYSIHLANRFSRKWRTLLAKASKKFHVDQEILVAVLLVETGFGNILGRYPIVSVYSSIIVENGKQQQCLLKYLNGCLDTKSLSRLGEKARWANKELKALIKISESSNRSLFRLKGSYAGAFGIPQFLPSSYLKWGYDSDRNGSVNLFLFPDAVYSTANYLKAHGWQKGLHLESNRDVVWKYNHSRIYVDTIFKIAQKVRVYPPRLSVSGSKPSEPRITLKFNRQISNNPS